MEDEIFIKCLVEDCIKKLKSRGYCTSHYPKFLREGKLSILHKKTLLDKFWEKVDMKTKNECWLWMGAISANYGQFKGMIGGKIKQTSAQRFSWELTNGVIPINMHVLHHCDNPICVNPQHLFLGTVLDNMRDKINKGRMIMPKGDNHYNSKLSYSKVKEIRQLAIKGEHHKKIASQFHVARTTITAVVNNRTWRMI